TNSRQLRNWGGHRRIGGEVLGGVLSDAVTCCPRSCAPGNLCPSLSRRSPRPFEVLHMRANHVKRRLKGGQPSVGTWLSLPCAPAARYMAQLGFDWLTVDTEHQPIGIETATAMFAGIAGAGPAPLARVPWNHGQNIKRVLDCG